MKGKYYNIVGIAAVFIVAVAAFYAFTSKNDAAIKEDVTKNDVEVIKSLVIDFGKKMQMVPLASSPEIVQKAVKENYGPFVGGDLLAVWEHIPSTIPGRTASSPWPDRIEIDSVTQRLKHLYTVKGRVIEITSKEVASGGIASSYPVTIQVARRGDWVITGFIKGYYLEGARDISIDSVVACLPHKGDDSKTLECAIGAKGDDGLYYSLDTTEVVTPVFQNIPIGNRVAIEGKLIPIETLSSDHWYQYDIKGIIRAKKIIDFANITWRTYQTAEVGLSLSYPQELMSGEFRITTGETGRIFSGGLNFSYSQYHLAAITEDYSVSKGGSWVVGLGYTEREGKYFLVNKKGEGYEVKPSEFWPTNKGLGKALVLYSSDFPPGEGDGYYAPSILVVVNLPGDFPGLRIEGRGEKVSDFDVQTLKKLVGSITF